MKSIVRNVHKYLSFSISLQLLLWTVSGIYFAFNKIEMVRGEQYILSYSYAVDLSQINLNIAEAENVRLSKRLNEEIIIITKDIGNEYLDIKGNSLDKLSTDAALKIVGNKTTLKPLNVEEIKMEKNGSEYRGRPLPLYKVTSKNKANEKINVYLNVFSGEILAIRSAQWRVWDLMWGFHIIDWQERDNINNFLLKMFSILALISSLTGLLLFFKVDIKK
ncbi:uncharacterized protein METZ01_LOCUS52677 [marine metagenome]|uniref:PepSY domain-containing protein n=1 Tax=marine metagenome TaxID=408172 RepID=A0A381SF89_9ZZZZ|tara:strand:- start:933 stop:1592 length:660 start_codon:yes stop_codon:yes gene_type:complete